MPVDEGDFLLALAGVSATLIGAFLVGVFFYLDLGAHRARTGRTAPVDRYLRAGTRGVFVAYAIPLIVPLVLAILDPIWGAVAFIALGALHVAATAGTGWLLIVRGGGGSSVPLILNELFTAPGVVVLAVLPWVLGGWVPPVSAFVPSLLISLGVGFASTAALVMTMFDFSGGSGSGRAERAAPDEPQADRVSGR